MVNKKLKLNEELDLPEDMLLAQDKVSSEFDTCLVYDFVLNQFGIGIQKETKEKKSLIKLTEMECDGVLRLMPYALKVADKYSRVKASKPVDIPLEPVAFNVGDMGTVFSIKESAFKRGDIQFDLRKCMKKEDGSLIHTREGVRLDADTMKLIQQKLQSYKKEIEEAVKNTRKLMMTARACLMIREINSLSNSGETKSCYGCETDHPSQIQHMGPGGCLAEDSIDASESWKETVNRLWSGVLKMVSVQDGCNLAEMALSLLPELKGLVCSCVEDMPDPLEDELKQMVIKKEGLASDTMYIACEKIMKDN